MTDKDKKTPISSDSKASNQPNDALEPTHSIENQLRQALRRLWVFGKKTEITNLLKFAQFPKTIADFEKWITLDEQEWLTQLKDHYQSAFNPEVHSSMNEALASINQNVLSEQLDRLEDDESNPSYVNQEVPVHVEKSEELSYDSGSLDLELTLSKRLGLRYNTPSNRYKIGQELARGGVGRVIKARDRQLNRDLVIKGLNKGSDASDRVMLNFIREAKITAQLEHPNIVPIHDLSVLAHGEVIFTMKRIRGQTLKDIIRALRHRDLAAQKKYKRLHLLEIFKKVCQAIEFAHSRGVLHRDLKPSNVMVGEYGEVLVLDWGIAKVIQGDFVVHPIRIKEGDGIERSAVVGTPSYMPPEQAKGQGHRVDSRSDIYALGAMLYEILTHRPPFRGRDPKKILQEVISVKPLSPREFKPELKIPRTLNEIVMKCLLKERSKRFQTVRELYEAIDDYLSRLEEFERNYKLSDQAYLESIPLMDAYKEQRRNLEETEAELLELQWSIPPSAPPNQRQQLWKKYQEVKAISLASQKSLRAVERSLYSALQFYGEHPKARRDLSYLYSLYLEKAEQERDLVDQMHYRTLLQVYNQGDFNEYLNDSAQIQVRSHPRKAKVFASRLVSHHFQLLNTQEEEWGDTPLNQHNVPVGRWQIRVESPGFVDSIYCINLQRNEIINIESTSIRESQISAGFKYIPAGDFKRRILDELGIYQEETEWVNEFAIRRYPVTCGEYLRFLNILHASNPEEASRRVPRLNGLNIPLWNQNKQGMYELPQATSDFPWSLKWPVFGISYEDAHTFCNWCARQTQLPLRLPTEVEWEKAMTGGDQRIFPWGDNFDPSFCKIGMGQDRALYPSAVASFPQDQSPYGLLGGAGGVSEYCSSDYSVGNSNLKVLKGGNFTSMHEIECRIASRQGVSIKHALYGAGFRIAYTLSSS